jgi:hypothetical protein
VVICPDVRYRTLRANATTHPTTDPVRTATVTRVDESGKPVVGAEVYLIDWFVGVDPGALTRSGPVATNSDGVATFGNLPASAKAGGQVFAYARIGGVAEQDWGLRDRSPKEAKARLVMRPAIDIRGAVSAPRGVALDRLTAEVISIDRKQAPSVLDRFDRQWHEPEMHFWPGVFASAIASDGSFVIRDMPQGAFVAVLVSGPGVAATQLRGPPVGNDPNVRFTADLERDGSLEGTLSYEDGRPASGVWIDANIQPHAQHNGRIIPVRAVTNAAGNFHIVGLAAGIYVITLNRLPDGWTSSPVAVRVGPAEAVHGVNLRLERGVVISGTIVEQEGQHPLAGAQIGAVCEDDPSGHMVARSAPTNAAGRFLIRVPKTGVRVYVFSYPPGLGEPDPDAQQHVIFDLDTPNVQITEPRFVAGRYRPNKDFERLRAPRSTFRGRVVDAVGNAVEGAHCLLQRVHPLTGDFSTCFSGKTKSDGSYEFRGVECAQECKVVVPQWSTSSAESGIVTPKPGESVEIEDLLVERRPAMSELSGIVVDKNDRAITGAHVRVNGIEWTTTDREGKFHFVLYDSDEPCELAIVAESFADQRFKGLPAGTKDEKFVLRPRMPGKNE